MENVLHCGFQMGVYLNGYLLLNVVRMDQRLIMHRLVYNGYIVRRNDTGEISQVSQVDDVHTGQTMISSGLAQ